MTRVVLSGSSSAQDNVTYVEAYRTVSANDAAMWQNAINAASNAGTTGGSVQAGSDVTYNFSAGSVPKLPVGLPSKLRIDLNTSTIKLSAAVPRAFDPARTADYQTLQNIELFGGSIDDNNAGGTNHLILGNYIAGVSMQRLNWDRVHLHDIDVKNAPVDHTLATARLFGVCIDLSTAASNEATQLVATNIRLERITVNGSGVGVYIGGTAADAGINSTPNAWIDNVTIAGIKHDLGVLPTSDFASATVQIGGNALVGTVRLRDVDSSNCGDVPIEFDNCANATARNCSTTDCYGYAYLTTNFRVAPNVNGGGADWSVYAQTVNWVGCRARRKALLNAAGSVAFGRCFVTVDATGLGGSTVHPIGTVRYTRCSVHRTAADASSVTLGEAFFLSGAVWKVAIRDCDATIENVANATGPHITSVVSTSFDLTTVPTDLEISGLRVNARGSVASGTFSWYGIAVDQSNAGVDLTGSIRDVTFNVSLPVSGSGAIAVQAGVAPGRLAGLRGALAISGLRFPTFGPYAAAMGVLVAYTGTFLNRGLVLSDCDFSTLSPTWGLYFDTSTPDTANSANTVVGPNIRWPQNNASRSPSGRVPTAADYSQGVLDRLVAVTSTAAARTITLPLASVTPPGQIYEVVDESNGAATHNITLARAGTDTFVDGATSKTISTNGGSLRYYSTGTAWALA